LDLRQYPPKPIWNNTLTPMARTQSTMRKAKMRGIELMYKLKNHLKDGFNRLSFT
jgi:hypothetical protein